MEITLTTPAFLFPAATFLLIAYTSRFLALGARIRLLHEKYLNSSSAQVLQQIISLRKRVILIKYMQGFGVFGLFLCVSCICALFAGYKDAGQYLFATSLACFLASLAISLVEIHLSVEALNFELSDIEHMITKGNKKD